METVQLVGGDYEHALGLEQERDGVRIRYTRGSPSAIFGKMILEQCYETCEFSLANLIMLMDKGAKWLSAIPVFPNRAFRHHILYVRKDSGIRGPEDLRGKRLAVEDYSMTAAVWVRGLLNEEYGVSWRDISWFCDNRQGRFQPPAAAKVTLLEGDPESLLEAGRVDAMMSSAPRDEHRPPQERKFRRLFEPAQQIEEDYYKRTGIFPINHCIVIRSDVLARLPHLPKLLFDIYLESKRAAYRRKLGASLVPWSKLYWSNIFDVFGGDPLPYGLTDSNIKVVSRLADYLHEQQLIDHIPTLESLFLPDSLAFRE